MPLLGADVCTGLTKPGRAGALAASSAGPAEALVFQTMSGDLTQARQEEENGQQEAKTA